MCVRVKSLYWPLLPALVTGKLFSMRGSGLGVPTLWYQRVIWPPLLGSRAEFQVYSPTGSGLYPLTGFNLSRGVWGWIK